MAPLFLFLPGALYPAAMVLALSNDILIPGVMMLGLMLIAWGATQRRRKKLAGQTPPSPMVERTISSARSSEFKAMADQISTLLVDLQDTARRIAAQIDNRYQQLDALLAEADEKIRKLEKLKAELGMNGSPVPAAPAAPAARAELSPPTASSTAQIEINPQHQAVYELADRGKNSREIAQQVGKQPGEVELILALRRGA